MKQRLFDEGVPAGRFPAGLLLVAVLLALFTGVAGSQSQPLPGGAAADATGLVPGELLVHFDDGVTAQAEAAIMTQVGATYVRNLYGNDVQLWRVPAGSELDAIDALNKMAGIDYAEPNHLLTLFDTIPNDPSYNKQWAHPIMRSPAGWDISTGSSAIKIAVLDTGIDLNHPDLSAKIVSGYDFIENDSSPWDEVGHGTHVAGIAGAVTNNGVGIAGVDWQARIMPVRVCDLTSCPESAIIDGIVYAYTNGANVINLSLGGPSYSQSMQNAVNSATASGVLVVAAMGNERDGTNYTAYPAAYTNVVAVSATDRFDQYTYYSSYGSHNDLSAPGGEMFNWQDTGGIYSTMPTYEVLFTIPPYLYFNNYDYLQGTSMATPQVAGLAALIFSLSPGMSPGDVEALMKNTAQDLGPAGWDRDYGYGRIDIGEALAQFSVPDTPTLNEIVNPNGDDSYTVSWNGVPFANNYVLQSDTAADFTSPTQVYSGPGINTQVNNSAPGRHYYRVMAEGTAGNSGWSNIQFTIVAPDAPVLNPINNPAGDDAYTVSWQAATGASGYILEEDDNSGFNSPKVRYVGPATAYQVTGQAGGTWYYRVSGYNEIGAGDFSNLQSTMVDPAVLPAPSLAAISLSGTYSYTVDWSAVNGATGYILEESTSPYFVNPNLVYSGPNTALDVVQDTGGTWYYRVRADGPAGMSPWSNEESVTIEVFIYLPVMLR